MKLGDVLGILDGLRQAGAPVWVDGGWCVDALVGRQLREHDDLDVAVDRKDELALRDWLAAQGFRERNGRDDTAWNYVATDPGGRSIDVHVFGYDPDGSYAYGVQYPPGSLAGEGELGGITVQCVTAEWMFRFKTSYEPKPKDLVDVGALADRFGFEVPESHRNPRPKPSQ